MGNDILSQICTLGYSMHLEVGIGDSNDGVR